MRALLLRFVVSTLLCNFCVWAGASNRTHSTILQAQYIFFRCRCGLSGEYTTQKSPYSFKTQEREGGRGAHQSLLLNTQCLQPLVGTPESSSPPSPALSQRTYRSRLSVRALRVRIHTCMIFECIGTTARSSANPVPEPRDLRPLEGWRRLLRRSLLSADAAKSEQATGGCGTGAFPKGRAAYPGTLVPFFKELFARDFVVHSSARYFIECSGACMHVATLPPWMTSSSVDQDFHPVRGFLSETLTSQKSVATYGRVVRVVWPFLQTVLSFVVCTRSHLPPMS